MLDTNYFFFYKFIYLMLTMLHLIIVAVHYWRTDKQHNTHTLTPIPWTAVKYHLPPAGCRGTAGSQVKPSWSHPTKSTSHDSQLLSVLPGKRQAFLTTCIQCKPYHLKNYICVSLHNFNVQGIHIYIYIFIAQCQAVPLMWATLYLSHIAS